MTATSQLSLFGADVSPLAPADLEGLLAGPGQISRMGGTARVSVVVAEEWRARALLAEFAVRGLGNASLHLEPGAAPVQGGVVGGAAASAPGAGEVADGAAASTAVGGAGDTAASAPVQGHPVPLAASAQVEGPTAPLATSAPMEGHIAVRTAFSACLAPLAARWLRGALTLPPEDLHLNGPRLRLWFIAAGRVAGSAPGATRSVTLGLSSTNREGWKRVGAALARMGLPATLVGPRAGGPGYRIAGRRNAARLAELIGVPADAAPPGAWVRPVSGSVRGGSPWGGKAGATG